MQQPSQALTVKCQACGSDIPIQELRQSVKCPYCGNVQVVDMKLLQDLASYQSSIQAHLDQAHRNQQQAEVMDFHYGRMKKGSGRTILISLALFMGLPMAVAVGFIGLVSAGVIPEESMRLMSVAIPVSVMLAFVLYFVWYYSGKRKKTAGVAMAETQMACPSCGAANVLKPGQVLEKCQYCGSMLVPSQEVMQHAVEAAHRAARTAEMQRFRKEREGIATIMSYSAGNWVIYLIAGSFLFMLVPASVMFSYQMFIGQEPYNPGIFLLWAMTLGLIGVVAGIIWWRRRMRRRWKESLGRLAGQFRGEVAAGLDGVVRWLNTYWAGPYPVVNIMAGKYGNGVAFNLQGFPAFLFVDPVAASQHHRAKVHLFVAAWIPGISDGTNRGAHTAQATPIMLDWLGRQDFTVEMQQAGLLARAGDDTVKKLRRRPEEAAGAAPIFMKLVEVARSVGAEPVAPIP